MNKMTGLAISLFLLSHAVAAGQAVPWVQVAQDNAVVMYMDTTSITKNGAHATANMLMDFNRDDNGFYSAAQTVQFACKEKTFRLLANKAYTEKMGGGELVAELKKPTPWQSIEPGSGWSVALRHACPKS